MNYQLCIFEDNQYSNLYPLSLTRPVYDLRCGILTLREKIERDFAGRAGSLFCREYLQDYVKEQNPGLTVNQIKAAAGLFINGAFLSDATRSKVFQVNEETIFVHEGRVVGAFLQGGHVNQFAKFLNENQDMSTFPAGNRVELKDAPLIKYPWDLVHHNPEQLERDFAHFNRGGQHPGNISPQAMLVNKSNIYIGKDATIKPGAILDAEGGPIYIDEGATIMHQAVIEGPVFIGKKSAVKIAAKIYEGTSIGAVCKVGGEVEESIIHSYSNKQHDGFLGHAYLGQWVNLGADTNNSDLKNNYGNVKVYINGEMVDTGSMFVGLTMGDHSKSGINTMFNTGTVVGAMCNVFGADFPPKYIPSFSWGGGGGLVPYELEKALKTAGAVMARRKKELTPAYEKIFRYLFESGINS